MTKIPFQRDSHLSCSPERNNVSQPRLRVSVIIASDWPGVGAYFMPIGSRFCPQASGHLRSRPRRSAIWEL